MDRRQIIAGLGGLAALGGGAVGAQTMSPDELKKRMAEFEAQQAQYRAGMLAQFPFPLVKCAGVDALAKWSELRAREQGYPVIIGDDEKFASLAEALQFNREDGQSPADALARASSFRFPEDYRARLTAERDAFRKTYADDARFSELLNLQDEDAEWKGYVTGEWPDRIDLSSGPSVVETLVLVGEEDKEASPPSRSIEDILAAAGSRNYESRPAPEVYIAIIPAQDWTEAFAYLGFGGWNANPFPHEHVSAFRSWNAKYDLELVGMSNDVLNLRCRRPPRTRDEAMQLAREQYEFCPDILQQGFPSAEALAAQLMGDEWWYFWWD